MMSQMSATGTDFRGRSAAARRAWLALTLALLASAAAPPARAQRPSPAPTPKEVEPDEVVRVETKLVNVPVSVRAPGGGYFNDLRREEFRVYEDGVEQQVAHFEAAEQPITIVLLLDYSVSVRAGLPRVREAAAAFLERLRPDDRVRAVAFGDNMVVLAGGDGDRRLLRESILAAPVQGGTSIYDATYFTLSRVVPARGRKAVVLFTDGEDTTSHAGYDERALRYAEEIDAPVHVLLMPGRESVLTRRGVAFLRELAEKTGGGVRLAGGRGDMTESLDKIAAELRGQYSVGYYPASAPVPGRRRKLKVVVTRPGAKVRAKGAYTVGTEGAAPR